MKNNSARPRNVYCIAIQLSFFRIGGRFEWKRRILGLSSLVQRLPRRLIRVRTICVGAGTGRLVEPLAQSFRNSCVALHNTVTTTVVLGNEDPMVHVSA